MSRNFYAVLVRRAALLMSVVVLITCAKGEEINMNTVPVTLQKYLKKAEENNPL